MSIKRFYSFCTAIRGVPVRALVLDAAGSRFKVQWSHFFVIECSLSLYLFLVRVRVSAASGISPELLRISDKRGKMA